MQIDDDRYPMGEMTSLEYIVPQIDSFYYVCPLGIFYRRSRSYFFLPCQYFLHLQDDKSPIARCFQGTIAIIKAALIVIRINLIFFYWIAGGIQDAQGLSIIASRTDRIAEIAFDFGAIEVGADIARIVLNGFIVGTDGIRRAC
jgi:hypothetical protein